MMTIRQFFILVFVSALAASCGDTGTNPGHNGLFLVDDIEVEDGPDIEVFCVKNPEEFLITAKRGTATLTNIPIGENTDPVPLVQVLSYTVDYISLDGGPALSSLDFPMEDSVVIAGGQTRALGVEVLPIATKRQYFNALKVTTTTSKYTAEYRFSGRNVYGVDVEAVGTTNFVVGSFVINCP